MIVLAPVYEPGSRLSEFVAALRDAAPGVHVVVVDDGSGPASARVLDAAGEFGCTVLRHATNRGKGVALKTGFRHVTRAYPGHDVVCADADGQHGVADVLRVAKRVEEAGVMVLGVRRFDGEVPVRSRAGNDLTRLLFRVATGCPVRDTQTGLRAYPHGLLDWLLTVPGERYEYEMNVLLYAARAGRPIEQATIATTYVGDNASSHFGSLTDSVRIYLPLLRFSASALLAATGISRRPRR
ncbi:Undecaprenyl-phosphate 4-deoxy-4-formamido-L-arabinose transferase [Micromonospora sp. MW-13]|uniref:glycosyltransferase family 2 protein n=1 Tax=Micromonospora sp. MW-13 TaxID=2094022 RepID=UPI000E44C26B|nr:glycosyltransferase family 2 protein [Micromonospora sp. MW-13]RGC69208.1 Undecaprenyl-phosphate 4-deoxy-4-formamido-L-arabinose transferase [Micromonospora sp. MW-13]